MRDEESGDDASADGSHSPAHEGPITQHRVAHGVQLAIAEAHQLFGIAEADGLCLVEQEVVEAFAPVQVRPHMAEVCNEAPLPAIAGSIVSVCSVQGELPEDAGAFADLVGLDSAEVRSGGVLLEVEDCPDARGDVFSAAGLANAAVVVNDDA